MNYIGKNTALLCLILILSFSALAGTKKNEAEATKGWKVEREEGDMYAECRKHKSGYRYCRIFAETHFSINELVGINTDAANLHEWMETVKTSKQLVHTNDQDYINCLQYKMPYPLYDRESCTRSEIGVIDGGKEVKIEFNTVKMIGDTIDHENMELIAGYWKFTDGNDGKNIVEYATVVLPGGSLVPFLYNANDEGPLNVPWKTMLSMFKRLEKGAYKNKKISFLVNTTNS